MPSAYREKSEVKVFILYLLLHIDRPVDFATLHDIVVQDDFVAQFDFMDCFYELCETDAIHKYTENGKELYTLTQKGKDATETLQTDLSRGIREKALRDRKSVV